jgi:hypothetical protein
MARRKKIIKPNFPYLKFFFNFLSLSNSIVHFMMNLKSTKRHNLESKINFELEGKDEKMRWSEERGARRGIWVISDFELHRQMGQMPIHNINQMP